MIRCAISGSERMEIDETEIRRGGVSYTVDTVRALSKSWPGARLFFIIGSDSLRELHTWRSIREIVMAVTFIVLSRTPDEQPAPDPELEKRLHNTPLRSMILPVKPFPVSSTEIRNSIRTGKPLRNQIPERVMQYIEKHGLYR